MPVFSADVTQGTLTGSGTQDTIGTASSGSVQETYSVNFRNYSGSTVTLKVFINGNDAAHTIAQITLLTLEWVIVSFAFGPSDYMKAEASAGSSVAWTCSKGILT